MFINEDKLAKSLVESVAPVIAQNREALTAAVVQLLTNPIHIAGTFGGVAVDATIQIQKGKS